MKVGDLVKRKPEWGDWVKHNPWMYTDKDLEIGVIIERVHIPGKRENKAFKILDINLILDNKFNHINLNSFYKWLTITPSYLNSDGFFICLLKKNV